MTVRRPLWWLAVQRFAANETDRVFRDIAVAGILWAPGGYMFTTAPDVRRGLDEDLVARRAVRDVEFHLAQVSAKRDG